MVNGCKLYYNPKEIPVLKNCSEFSDLPENEKILVYPLREIAAAKTVALLDRARTEPRDLYDLWYLTDNINSIDISDCLDAVEEKLLFRNKNLDDVKGEFSKKEIRLEKTWQLRLGAQMANLPEFEHVYRAVKRALRQAKI